METLTVVVPVFNEEQVLPHCYQRLSRIADDMSDLSWEFLFVDDGSSDGSMVFLRQVAAHDPRVRFIKLARNFGKEAALSAGINYADGDAVVIIDADLQDPPELIPQMVSMWREGYDTVYGQRTARHGETLIKRLTASYFYKVMGILGRVRIPKDTGDFRLLSRRSILALRQLPESNRFMKGLFAWIGYRQIALPYTRDPRHAGNTKFNYWRLWNFAIDGITSFTTVPLKLATYFGLLLAMGSFAYGIYIVLKTLVYGDPVPGFPTLMTVILFLGGVQFLFLGILGEYLGRMFDETKHRPLYLIDECHLIDNPELPEAAVDNYKLRTLRP